MGNVREEADQVQDDLVFLQGKEGQEAAPGQREQLDRLPQASLDNVVNELLEKVHEHKSGRKERKARAHSWRTEARVKLPF